MKHLTLNRRTLVTLMGVGALGLAHAQVRMDTESVTLEVARQELESGKSLVIDIREPQEHATGVAPGMQLLPMRQLASRISEIPNDPKRPVLLICNTQNRSSATWKYLREKGYTNVRFVQGGMSEWTRRAWPLVKP
jgi:rhodanese-related sulfurtransferase